MPSARAVGLARGRTCIVGMLVPSLTWPWMGCTPEDFRWCSSTTAATSRSS